MKAHTALVLTAVCLLIANVFIFLVHFQNPSALTTASLVILSLSFFATIVITILRWKKMPK